MKKFTIILLMFCSCSNPGNEKPQKSIKQLEHELDSLKEEKEIIDAISSMDTIEKHNQDDSDPIIRTRDNILKD